MILQTRSLVLDLGNTGLGELSVSVAELDGDSIRDQTSLLLVLLVLGLGELGESPVLRHGDLLAAGVLELGTTKSLLSNRLELGGGADGHDDLSNLNTRANSEGLSESSTHTGLKTIGSGARQHLVDAENVERVETHAKMESVLSGVLDHALVGGNTGSFKRLGRDLLLLQRQQMDARGEIVCASSLTADIVNANLSIGDTTAITRLDIRLVLLVPVALPRSASHGFYVSFDVVIPR
jgi:hypothetical protein